MQYQKKKINHADPRERFISPAFIQIKTEKNGLCIDYFNEIRAVQQIDRRYYSFVLSL